MVLYEFQKPSKPRPRVVSVSSYYLLNVYEISFVRMEENVIGHTIY